MKLESEDRLKFLTDLLPDIVPKLKNTTYTQQLKLDNISKVECLTQKAVKEKSSFTFLGAPSDLIEIETKFGNASHLVFENTDIFFGNNIVTSMVKRTKIR